MPTYYVWNAGDTAQMDGRSVFALSAREAAEWYAETDEAGLHSGLYDRGGTTLHVQGPDDSVVPFRVLCEPEEGIHVEQA